MDHLSSIIQPVITEKSTLHNTQNKYMFKVQNDADKGTIRKAFEELYGVKATSIRTYLLPKKERMIRRGKVWIKRPVAKRAIITVEKGKNIDPNKLKK